MENNNNIRLIVMNSFAQRGAEVASLMQEKYGKMRDLVVPIKNPRFSNGEAKGVLDATVRKKDVFILSDIGNHGLTYKFFDEDHHTMSPDEHFQDIKRAIAAIKGHASSITVVMPILYESRQHKANGRESLDCAIALQELQNLGVNGIVTFDVHSKEVQNAIPLLPFDNFYPTHIILKDLLQNETLDLDNLTVVSPDTGATERAKYYAELLDCDLGLFYKRRNLREVGPDGKNKVEEHTYLGGDVNGKDLLVVDDMIASGESMLDVVEKMKERGANKIFLSASFSLFTEGVDSFDRAYNDGMFNKVYAPNLTYAPEEYLQRPWISNVDCMPYLSDIIYTLGTGNSIEDLLNGKEEILSLTRKRTNR